MASQKSNNQNVYPEGLKNPRLQKLKRGIYMNRFATSELISEIHLSERTLNNPSNDIYRREIDSAVASINRNDSIKALSLQNPLKNGVGCEFIQPKELASSGVNEALNAPNKVSVNASIDRVEMLKDVNLLDMGLSTAHDMKASNSVQQMLAHQLASAHKYAMENFKNSELHKDPSVKVKFGNLAVRLMEAYSRGALTLQRLQIGNAQTVTVQHVNVEGQAVITGSLHMGGQSNGK